jgi:ABC-type Fe3+-hydroxamate transport system substrate-binding protein
MKPGEVIDIRGVSFRSIQKPYRVVCLVPSWTETLFYLGLTAQEIVGRTDYCIYPRARVGAIEKLGGPRNPDLQRMFELQPDLIIMDREENRKEDVEWIDMHWAGHRVFVTGPTTVAEALYHVGQLGSLLTAQNRACQLVETVRSWVDRVVREDRGNVAYLVWQDPFIAATRETYVGDVLDVLGFKNIFDRSTLVDLNHEGSMRYPAIPVELLCRLKPDAIFLSTEPFPFRGRDLERLRFRLREHDKRYAAGVDIRIVNGEYFSWYGSRMIPAFRHFVRHHTER